MDIDVLNALTWYYALGLVSAWMINRVIAKQQIDAPYTTYELAIVITLWPINVILFAYGFIKGLLR